MARTTDPVLTALGGVDLFEGLSAKDLRQIRDAGKEVDFREGEELAVQGSQGGRFFVILDGEVSISIRGQARPSLHPGDYLGEISLIDGEPRLAHAVAATPVHTWTLASFSFRPILRAYPSISQKVMVLLCRRLRAAEAALEASEQPSA
jgi:CRP-like cAMP-binding protein